MAPPKVYADFQNLDDDHRVRLTCAGTLQDLVRQGLQLQQGLVLTLYSDDADDQCQPDELRAEGVVRYDTDGQCWVAIIDWAAIHHASQEEGAGAKSLISALLPREEDATAEGQQCSGCDSYTAPPEDEGQAQ